MFFYFQLYSVHGIILVWREFLYRLNFKKHNNHTRKTAFFNPLKSAIPLS